MKGNFLGNILIVLPNDQLDGAEQVLYQMATFYALSGYLVDVFFLKLRKFGGWDGMHENVHLFFTKVNKERFGIPQMIGNLREEAFTKRYAFAYTSHTQISGIIGILRFFGFLKVDNFVARESTSIFIRFGGWKLIFFKLCYRLGYLQTDLLICQTGFMKEQLLDGMPSLFKKVKRIAVIPNPIQYDRLQQIRTGDRPHPRKYLVSAGRLIPEKGFDLLVAAFKELSALYPDLDLIILGKGNLKKDLEAQIEQTGMKDRVKMTGHVPDVYTYFKHAEACVVSSRCEGFPNVLLQMMSQNKRVVSTLCAGDIDKLEGVFTCAPDDAAALEAIISISLSSSCDETPALFDAELRKRDIVTFIKSIDEILD